MRYEWVKRAAGLLAISALVALVGPGIALANHTAPAPTNLEVSSTSCTENDLKWTKSTDGDVDHQHVVRRDGGVGAYNDISGELSASTESYDDIGLTGGTVYDYKIGIHDVDNNAAHDAHSYRETGAVNGNTPACEAEPYDETPPTIVLSTPADDAVYILNEVVLADYSCDDDVAVDSCEGDVANGSAIDTSTVGAHSFTVNATDTSGNEATLTHNYTVVYAFGGFRQPVLTPVTTFKAGSTIPVKFTLTDAGGNPVGTAVASAAGSLGESADCRYDETDQQYICNLKTPKGASGDYTITVTLNDGSTHEVTVTLK
ncbi:MAG: PxKF domain-containing protein [Chloroflexi bacterium]|nr:PxKF domain-containing protein [Chloroflexota bacterium]